MNRFVSALRAELLKVFTTRSWWVLALVMALYVAFSAAAIGLVVTVFPDDSGAFPTMGSPGLQQMVYSLGGSIGYIFPVLLGALAVTGEYRHRTVTPTFTSVGSRGAVLGGKVTVQALMGMFYGVIALLTAVLTTVFIFVGAGNPSGLADGSTWLMFLRATVAMGIWAVIGVGLGVLVRSQAAAIVIVIVFTQFIEPIARTAGALNETVGSVVSYLPGSASDSFIGQSFYTVITAVGGSSQLEWWGGALVLLGYALVLVVLGWWLRWRQDVS